MSDWTRVTFLRIGYSILSHRLVATLKRLTIYWKLTSECFGSQKLAYFNLLSVDSMTLWPGRWANHIRFHLFVGLYRFELKSVGCQATLKLSSTSKKIQNGDHWIGSTNKLGCEQARVANPTASPRFSRMFSRVKTARHRYSRVVQNSTWRRRNRK